MKKNAPGCCGCGCTVTLISHVNAACGTQQGGLVGATVTARRNSDNVLLATGTTDASGNVTLTFNDPLATTSGTYKLQATKPPRWGTSSITTVTVTCGGSQSRTLSVPLAAGFTCCLFCAEPIPTVLHLTDPVAARTLTFNGSILGWFLCISVSEPNGQAFDGAFSCLPAAVNGAMAYTLKCPTVAGGPFTLRQEWSTCGSGPPDNAKLAAGFCGSTSVGFTSPGGRFVASNTVNGSSGAPAPACTPLSLTFNLTGTYYIPGTVTVTE